MWHDKFVDYLHAPRRLGLTLALIMRGGVAGCGQEVSAAKRAVERQLKDPGSVEYRDVQTFAGGVVCGEFNARNSLGGYVGFSQFVYNAPRAGEVELQASPVKVNAWCNSSPMRAEVIKRMCEQSWANTSTQTALGCEVVAPAAAAPERPRAGR